MRYIHRCPYDGCDKTTESELTPGWSWHSGDGKSGFIDGLYCPEHSQAIEDADPYVKVYQFQTRKQRDKRAKKWAALIAKHGPKGGKG